jgi:hypothetical protein
MPSTEAGSASAGLVGLIALLAACNFQPPTGSGGGQSHGGSSGGGDGGVKVDAATGAECSIPTMSGAMLCETINLCPGLTVDQNAFNGCGFLVAGKTIDIECECSGYLCSAGTLPTCAAAKLVLAEQSATQICSQLSSGGCNIELMTSGSGSGQGGCNESCASLCQGDPTCTASCGC